MEDVLPIFFNVNTQKDFFIGSYKIPTSEHILNNLNDLTQYAKLNNIKVINSAGWYTEDSKHLSDNPDYVKTFPKHCLIDSAGAIFLRETSPEKYFLMDWNNPTGMQFNLIHSNNNIIVTKKNMDFFEGNSYSEMLIHNLGVPIKQRPLFLVYGIDVGPTVLGLLKRGYSVQVVEDANRTLQGLPFKRDDILEQKQNLYPDQIQSISDETPLKFIKTKEVLSL